MIRRFTSAQFVPANAGAKAKNPEGSTLFSTPMASRPVPPKPAKPEPNRPAKTRLFLGRADNFGLHSSATPTTRFFARVVASQLVRDYAFSQTELRKSGPFEAV